MQRENQWRTIEAPKRAVSICPYCKLTKPYRSRLESLIFCVGCKRVYLCDPVAKENWMLFEDYDRITKEEFSKGPDKKDGRGKHPNSLKNLRPRKKLKSK